MTLSRGNATAENKKAAPKEAAHHLSFNIQHYLPFALNTVMFFFTLSSWVFLMM